MIIVPRTQPNGINIPGMTCHSRLRTWIVWIPEPVLGAIRSSLNLVILDNDLLERFNNQYERLTLQVSSFGIIFPKTASSGCCDDRLGELRTYLRGNWDIVAQFVKERLRGMRTTIPKGAYFAWLHCCGLIARGVMPVTFEYFLEHAKVAPRVGALFGLAEKVLSA